MNQPVYPKEDPEYKKRIMEQFYKRLSKIRWDVPEEGEYQGKPRGRKPKTVTQYKAQIRQGEKFKLK
jgi:hypothetical protein